MSIGLHCRGVTQALAILVTMTSLGCNKAPPPETKQNKVPVDVSPCAQLVREICTQCGEISASCQRLRRSPPTRKAHCLSGRKTLNGTTTTARTYDGYCRRAAWVAADVNRVSRRGSSAEPAACRRFSFEVCHLCGERSSACTGVRKKRASTGATCKRGVIALLRPRKHKLCQRAAGWKALKITPPAPKATPSQHPPNPVP